MKLRDKKGSIAIFVLVMVLFMSAFLLILYGYNVNKSKTIKEQFNIISNIYAYESGDEGAYDKAYTDLREKNKQILTASSETSSIELTKTFEEKIENLKIYGNSIQEGTPSPENPVEVQSVGRYIEKLYNKDTLIDGYIKNDGTVESVNWYKCTDYIEISGDYLTYSNTCTTSATLRYYAFYDENKNFISGQIQKTDEEGATSYTIAIPSGAKYFRCNVAPSKVDLAQIDLGKEMIKSENYGKYEIPLKVSGKNLLNYPNGLEWAGVYTIAQNIYIEDGEYTLSFDTSVKGGESSPAILIQGQNGAPGGGWCQEASKKFTLSGTYNILAYSNGASAANSSGVTSKIQKLMLEKGESLEYEPYHEPQIFNIYLNEPLRKVGEFADYIDLKTSKVIRNIAVIENYNIENVYKVNSNTVRFGTYNAEILTKLDTKEILCEILQYKGQWLDDEEYAFKHDIGQNHFYLSFTKSRLGITDENTEDEMKQKAIDYLNKLSKKKIYYPMDKTVEESIRIPEITTYEDYTNIEVLTEISPSKIEAEYIGYTLE